MMTREDILRELELLPVWQLRVPVVAKTEVQVTQSPVESIELKQESAIEEVVIAEVTPQIAEPKLEAGQPQIFTYFASENNEYLFVLASVELSTDESLLLKNIMMAMRIRSKASATSNNIVELIKELSPKCVIAMGDNVVQALLQTTETLTDLRQKLHAIQEVTLIATYDLNHLLRNLSDKAKAWEDLCMAMQVVKSHQSKL